MKLLKKLNVFGLGLTLLLAAGCSGNEEHQNDPSPIDSSQRTCQLADEGTSARYAYFYHSNGKLDQMIAPDGVRKYVAYNAAGNMTEIRSLDANSNLVELVTITYNANNLPESRLTRYTPVNSQSYYWQAKNYYNSANQLIKRTLHLDDTVTSFVDIYSYPAADQVIDQYYRVSATGTYQLESTFQTFYDNMKSPTYYIGYLWSDEILLSSHNPTKAIRINHLNNTTVTNTCTYDYNSEGFPIKRIGSIDPTLAHTWTYNCQ